MHEFLKNVFSNIPRETSVSLFGWQHWLFILTTVIFATLMSIIFAKKSQKTKDRVLNITAITIISLYIFDLFVQPFWNDGKIAISKLPFHLCTFVGVLIPFVNFSGAFRFAKQTVVVWSVLASLAFILFPLKFINRPIEPYSYPIIQTFLFHGLEFFWGVFMLVSKKVVLRWRDLWQPIVGLLPAAAWATLGQELYYPATRGENFMFLRTDISAYAPQWLLLPTMLLTASVCIALLYCIYRLIAKRKASKAQTIEQNV